jgi:hypothetical protein
MSSQLQVSGEAKIRDIQGPVVANSGVITALDGAASQYVRGDGTLADFPTSSGGGSSVSYYLNSSVSQGTIGGVAYRQLGKTPIAGAGTDIAISSNGYVASYITDANDPALLEVPAGNFNCEFYFSVNNNSGNPFVYAEVYKYDGTTFTLIGTSVGVPEYINQGTVINPYYFAIPVAQSVLTVTDRIAIRIYVNVSGRTVTLHTENNHLCQVITTFSKGLISLNNLTRQNQFFATGTSGTDFGISSSVATHTFNLPVASATNTGKLSSTDWSTFNNKQNTITDPITGIGNSTQIAYFNSPTSITSEAAFNYDASTNRLGVNTSVPNATIGANAGTDSGYSLLLKNDNANYNGIGFGTDSTYGNLIATEKLGTAPARNLTLLNQSGYISITEVGNLGVNILSPNTGLDIYNGTSAYLWLHTANSGITGTDGVRLALFSTNAANLRNYEGAFSITAEGDFSIITLGAENLRVNSADGSIYQSKVANALLKSVSGVITAAVANTDYQSPISLTTSGSSGAATFSSNILNVPNYTLSGLGGVPTSRTLSINGVSYDLSADRSWTITSDITGSGADGRVAYWNGTNSITSEAGFIYDASTNRLGVNTSVPNATIGADAALDSGYGLLIKTGASNYNGIGIAIDSTYGNLISTEKIGSATARNLTLLNQSGFVSLKENGNFGVNTLNPSVSGTGIDIYGSTSTSLRLHTATSGTTVTDGAGINFSAANNLGITNYENGTIDIVTNGNSGVFVATNGFVGINGATPSVALTVNGGASISNLTTGQVLFPTSGGTLSGSSSLFWDNTNAKLGIGTSTLSGARVTITSTSDANHLQLVANAPALTFTNALSITYYAGIGMATASNNFVTGAVQGDLVLGAFNTSSILFCNNNTNTLRMSLNGSGAAIFSGSVTARGPKSQIIADGNSVGAGILLSNSIVGVNRRNWGIFTEQDVEGDFVIKRSTVSGGDAQSGTTILSLSRDGAATFSSSVTAYGPANDWGLSIWGSTTTGQSFGGIVRGGTNSSDVAFRVNNAANSLTYFTVQGNGNVGIGTGSPSSPSSFAKTMTIYDASSASYSFNVADTYRGEIGMSSGGGWLSTYTNDPFRFITNNTERMRITSGGNVLIGTTTFYNGNFSGSASGLNINGAVPISLLRDAAGNTFYMGLSGAAFIGTQNAIPMVFITSDAERMRISSGGKVEISIPTLANALKLNGANSYFTQFIKGGSGTGTSYGLTIAAGTNSSDTCFECTPYNESVSYFRVRGDGLMFSPPTYASTTGNAANVFIFSGGDFGRSTSSRKYKKNIIDYQKGLAELMTLRPVSYESINEREDGMQFAGLIAEEIEDAGFTEFVQYAEDGTPDAISYGNMIALMTKAIQEQQAQIEELKELIKNK